MAVYRAGGMIKYLREKKGLTQEQLVDGLGISVVTLSRVENGKQHLSKDNFDAIMQRLGESEDHYLSHFMAADEYAVYELKKKVSSYVFARDYIRAELTLRELEQTNKCQKGLNRQFLLLEKAIILKNKKMLKGEYENRSAAIQKMLDEAIRITIPRFDEAKVNSYMLTDSDRSIINEIAMQHILGGDIERGVALLYALKSHIEQSSSDDMAKTKSRYYIMVLYNLSIYVGKNLDNPKEALVLCDLGIRACKESQRFAYLPKLTFNKAFCLHQIGDDDTCMYLLPQAYHGLCMVEDFDNAKEIKDYAKKNFGMTL